MGREKRPITDWWPRERKAVIKLNRTRVKQMEEASNEKSEETKTAAGLQDSGDD